MYAILIFLDMKGADLRDSIIHFKSDNQPTVDTLTNETSKSPHLMTIIRVIVLIYLNYNIRFTISHVTGHANVHADHLTWLQLPKFLNCIEDIKSLQFWKLWAWVCPLSSNTLPILFKLLTDPICTMCMTGSGSFFQQFLTVYNKSLNDLSEHLLMEFIACLSLIPLAPGSIWTYMSGVCHHFKIRLLPDFSSSFLIALALKGVISPECQDDIHLPISLHVLHLMFDALPHVTHAYNAMMFRAILLHRLLCTPATRHELTNSQHVILHGKHNAWTGRPSQLNCLLPSVTTWNSHS